MLKSGRVMPQIKEPDRQDCERDETQGDCRRTGEFRCLVAEIPAAESIHRSPCDPAAGVKNKEAPPAHTIDAGQECGQSAQYCNKPPEEDDLSAVMQKQLLA